MDKTEISNQEATTLLWIVLTCLAAITISYQIGHLLGSLWYSIK